MSTNPQESSQVGNQAAESESTHEAKRTWAFVVAAIGALLITGLVEWSSRPEPIEEYGKVGQEFYPDFKDPTTATSLTVSVIDPDEVKPLEFSVKQAENGQWVIPSHHNYPADAADQLAKTAGSLIGIERDAMVSRWASDHARYGVVDPQTDSVGIDELEGIGKRITLEAEDGTVLASYIVGNEVEDEGDGNRFYVRHPNEDETYIADLDIDLTTRFRDWVNTDLLDVTASDVRRIELNDYSFDELRGTLTGSVESVLSRDSGTEDWKLAGIDEATQQVNETAVTDTLNTLANLEIAGVRPKQPGLTADLRLDRSALKSQRDVDRLQSDLLARGFLLQPKADDKEQLELIAREGEMFVGSDDGLLYRLYFGRVFTGSDQELEIGLSADGEAEESGEGEADASESKGGEEASEAESESGKPGRYVFVRVNLDPSLLGEAPSEPVEPKEPEEIKSLEEKIKQAQDADQEDDSESESDEKETKEEDESEADGDDEADVKEEGDNAEPSEGDEGEDEETDEEKLQRLRTEFANAKADYQSQVTAYEEYQQKIKDGKEKAEELNRRFALWYYVIPGESYDKLALNREDLIEPKESEEDDADKDDQATDPQADINAGPSISGLGDALMQEPNALQAPENEASTEEPKEQPAEESDAQPEKAEPETAESEKEETGAEEPAEQAEEQPADESQEEVTDPETPDEEDQAEQQP